MSQDASPVIPRSASAKAAVPAKRLPARSSRIRTTAASYVDRMDLPRIVRAPLAELAARFDDRGFLPTIGDVRNFLLFCDYHGSVPKNRGAAVPCVFKLLARMDPARVIDIRDERMFSGPASMVSIADAIGRVSSDA